MKVLINLLSFALILLFTHASFAQTCGCDKTITQSGIYRPTSMGTGPFYLNLQPGDTVCVAAGNYTMLRFIGFQGSAEAPIVVKNCGGRVTIGHNSYYAALDFQGCKYFHVTGTGNSEFEYGFRIDSCGVASALAVGALSSNFEVDHIEIAKAGFAGMMMKTDPNCNSNSWQGNFAMYDIDVHHNYIHDVGGEGFYIGNSFYSYGMTIKCNGVNTQVYPHLIYGLQIHHNIVERSGAECIQYACAPGAMVHDNVATNCGISPFAAYQNNGIQCGGGAGGDCYNNVVRNVGGSGLAILGHLGNDRFYNNLLVNCGGDAIFCDDRPGSLPNTYCDFLNNTIVNSGRNAMRLYNQNNTMLIANNVMVKAAGPFIVFQQGATATQQTNYTSSTFVPGVFTDTVSMRPAAGSPLINTGTDLASLGVTYDLDNIPRPVGEAFDKGSFEYCSGVPGVCEPIAWFRDLDADGFGNQAVTVLSLPPAPVGYVANFSDCDDTNASINPTVSETCNSVDDNCNGIVDDNATDANTTWYPDLDADGYGVTDSAFVHCATLPDSYGGLASLTGGDCDDANDAVRPGIAENCNLVGAANVDDDCDGTTDEDISAPTVVCKNSSIALGAAGTATLPAAWVNGSVSDNCTAAGNLAVSASPNTFDCAALGDNLVALSVTDAAGNSANCTATVAVFEAFYQTESAHSTPSDGIAGEKMGWSAVLDSDWAAFGMPEKRVGTQNKQGAAYLYDGAAGWPFFKKITAADGAAIDYFGNSAALDGTMLALGAYGDNIGANNDQGSAYIYSRDAPTANAWGQIAQMKASDGAAYEYFGSAVAVKNGVALVGANKAKVNNLAAQGAAYLFGQDVGGANNWGQIKKITASDGAASNMFGQSTCLNPAGDSALVGAPGCLSNRGAAYFFHKNTGGADNWGQVKKIMAADAVTGDWFGASLSKSGDCVLIGAPNKAAYKGAAYIFYRNQGGADNWGQAKKITASDGAANDRFGCMVSLAGDYAYVSALKANGGTGAVYVFHRNHGGADNWGQIAKYTASDAAANDQFGYALAATESNWAAGANLDDMVGKTDVGSMYVFEGTLSCAPPRPTGERNAARGGAADAPNLTCRPNPFQDELNVEITAIGAARLTLSDAAGRVLASSDLPAGTSHYALKTNEFRAGMYFVQVISESGTKAVPVALVR